MSVATAQGAALIAALMLSGLPASANAACKAPETAVFSCELSRRGGQLELCAAGSRTQPAFPLTLTQSQHGRVRLQFIQRSASDAQQFLYAFYSRYQVSRTELRAPRPATLGGELVLYSHFENDGPRLEASSGLRMGSLDLACRRVARNRLATLEALLACDPDSELGINACPTSK